MPQATYTYRVRQQQPQQFISLFCLLFAASHSHFAIEEQAEDEVESHCRIRQLLLSVRHRVVVLIIFVCPIRQTRSIRTPASTVAARVCVGSCFVVLHAPGIAFSFYFATIFMTDLISIIHAFCYRPPPIQAKERKRTFWNGIR